MVLPGNLTDQEIELIDTLRLDEEEVNTMERQTRQQAECEKWKEVRCLRFTASKFHLISKPQRNRGNFAETLLNPQPVSSKCLEHGKKK